MLATELTDGSVVARIFEWFSKDRGERMARKIKLDKGAPIIVGTAADEGKTWMQTDRLYMIAIEDRRHYRQMTQTQALELAMALIETVVEMQSEAVE